MLRIPNIVSRTRTIIFVFVHSAPQVNLSPSFEKKTWLLSIYSIYMGVS